MPCLDSSRLHPGVRIFCLLAPVLVTAKSARHDKLVERPVKALQLRPSELDVTALEKIQPAPSSVPSCNISSFEAANLRQPFQESISRLALNSHGEAAFVRVKHLAKEPKMLPQPLLNGSWWVVTAYNPMGQLVKYEENVLQNNRMHARLHNLQPKPKMVVPSWNGLGTWREEGFTVHFLHQTSADVREAMLDVCRRFCQAALYHFEVEAGSVLMQEVVPCFAETLAVASRAEAAVISAEEAFAAMHNTA
eukprot:gnl/TRDRNA2_/TRDRNA2_80360_c0_seq1.p1 gnl/TRDRNA2_/TRDRNA2_80360_c0~~gnl/TRDRNA2_/TRDRNA2_80360_c0_seq1.p1  ORF type:complete len:250 (+),score=31.04 gnl/TRDRNA2_/TRDRNA2_80360_c0_seq1:54-803(+)